MEHILNHFLGNHLNREFHFIQVTEFHAFSILLKATFFRIFIVIAFFFILIWIATIIPRVLSSFWLFFMIREHSSTLLWEYSRRIAFLNSHYAHGILFGILFRIIIVSIRLRWSLFLVCSTFCSISLQIFIIRHIFWKSTCISCDAALIIFWSFTFSFFSQRILGYVCIIARFASLKLLFYTRSLISNTFFENTWSLGLLINGFVQISNWIFPFTL